MADWNLRRVSDLMQQAAFDPTLWPSTLHELSGSIGALGAAILSEDKRLTGVPFSRDIEGLYIDYVNGNWIEQDERYQALPTLLRKGVACDQDLTTPEDVATRPYYQDFLARHGCRWFAALGHVSQSGAWVISIQRTVRQGAFQPEETHRLASLCRSFADAGFLSRRLSLKRCEGLADAMEVIQRAALVLDKSGRILALNSLAEQSLAEQRMGDGLDVARNRLSFRDLRNQAAFDSMFAKAINDEALDAPRNNAMMVRDRSGMPVQIRAVALRDWVRFTFSGARVLLLISSPLGESHMRSTYGLTRAEVALALHLSAGHTLAAAAGMLGITYETARSRLKTVFMKTYTHHQGQLIALVRDAADRSGS